MYLTIGKGQVVQKDRIYAKIEDQNEGLMNVSNSFFECTLLWYRCNCMWQMTQVLNNPVCKAASSSAVSLGLMKHCE